MDYSSYHNDESLYRRRRKVKDSLNDESFTACFFLSILIHKPCYTLPPPPPSQVLFIRFGFISSSGRFARWRRPNVDSLTGEIIESDKTFTTTSGLCNSYTLTVKDLGSLACCFNGWNKTKKCES